MKRLTNGQGLGCVQQWWRSKTNGILARISFQKSIYHCGFVAGSVSVWYSVQLIQYRGEYTCQFHGYSNWTNDGLKFARLSQMRLIETIKCPTDIECY